MCRGPEVGHSSEHWNPEQSPVWLHTVRKREARAVVSRVGGMPSFRTLATLGSMGGISRTMGSCDGIGFAFLKDHSGCGSGESLQTGPPVRNPEEKCGSFS